MSPKTPPTRPALRRSVDADLHPALAGRAGRPAVPGRGPSPALRPEPAPEPAKGRPAKTRRAATSDVLRPSKNDPAVKLTVTMPKSLRKRIRARAKQQGVEPEVLAARLIAEALR